MTAPIDGSRDGGDRTGETDMIDPARCDHVQGVVVGQDERLEQAFGQASPIKGLLEPFTDKDCLRRMLEENDLTFLGFLQFSFAETRTAYRAMFPHDPMGMDINSWEKFEIMRPATFRRMYQFWAQKKT